MIVAHRRFTLQGREVAPGDILGADLWSSLTPRLQVLLVRGRFVLQREPPVPVPDAVVPSPPSKKRGRTRTMQEA